LQLLYAAAVRIADRTGENSADLFGLNVDVKQFAWNKPTTPILTAAKLGHHHVIEFLRLWGAVIPPEALIIAAGAGHANVVKQLLKYDVPLIPRALHDAVIEGHAECVDLLLQAHVRTNTPLDDDGDWRKRNFRAAMTHAVERGHVGVISKVFPPSSSPLSIFLSAVDEPEQLMSEWHQATRNREQWRKPSPGSHESSAPLAQQNESLSFDSNSRGLAEKDIWLGVMSIDAIAQPSTGRSLLSIACAAKRDDVVRCLLNAKATISQTDLHLAVSSGSVSIAQLLLTARADVCGRDEQGFTPLERAKQFGHMEMIEVVDQWCAILKNVQNGTLYFSQSSHSNSQTTTTSIRRS
jgi:ankyrin repeat protein